MSSISCLARRCVVVTCIFAACSEAAELQPEIPGAGAQADYSWALEATDADAAQRRLEAYLERYSPAPHGFEDAVHVRYYRLAQYELLRSYYTAGMVESADRMLEDLRATDAEVR